MKDLNAESLAALDLLHEASVYLRMQWKNDLERPRAAANLEARSILFNASNRILTESGCGITRAEFEGAMILDREARR